MLMLTRGALVLALGLSAGAPAPAAAEDLLVTQYRADPSGAAYAIALAKSFFAKAGVDITGIISGDGGGASVRSAMASGLGFGDVSPAPAIAAIDQGQDIKIVNITSRSIADLVLIVMPNSPLKTAQDLKGKKFGISNPKSLGEMMGVLVMEKAGLQPNDLQRVTLGSLSGALTALENGVVDATSMPLILFRMRGGTSKYRVLLGGGDLPDIPAQLGIATGALMKQNPARLRAIEQARRDGAKFIYEHTDEAIGILSKVYEPLPPNEVAAMVKELVAVKFWSEGAIEKPLLENTIRGMKYVGMIDKDIDIAKLVDTSFLPADLQK